MKTILITGASQGIGAATGQAFWNAGWHVGLLARNAAKLT
ncbi:MAG: SDR family NAD(P)-dependent oxidoreductase, partial [Pseudomonadota bacterium]